MTLLRIGAPPNPSIRVPPTSALTCEACASGWGASNASRRAAMSRNRTRVMYPPARVRIHPIGRADLADTPGMSKAITWDDLLHHPFIKASQDATLIKGIYNT